MKTFVMGDIHGAFKALTQCLNRAGFDRAGDRLVLLGDVVDGWPDVRLCVDELLKIKHCDYIIGNHDLWALDWALSGKAPSLWTSQGGESTIESYGEEGMPQEHIHFLQKAHPWLVIANRAFVHGGFDYRRPLIGQPVEELVWDRDLLYTAWTMAEAGKNDQRFGQYEDIFLGHTPTTVYNSIKPIHVGNVWAIDTGAGWSGMLTIMNVHTKDFWQSDPTPQLYRGFEGRRA